MKFISAFDLKVYELGTITWILRKRRIPFSLSFYTYIDKDGKGEKKNNGLPECTIFIQLPMMTSILTYIQELVLQIRTDEPSWTRLPIKI